MENENRTFTNMIDDLRRIDGLDYELIAPIVDEIITDHEHQERRIYDLEGDLKERDDYIEKSKRESWERMRKDEREADEEKDEAEDEEEKKIVSVDEMLDTPDKKKEEDE